MATDALELFLFSLEKDNDPIPVPSKPEKLKIPQDAFVSMVEVYMPPVRDEMANKSINKTLTLPCWLNNAAE